MISRRESEINLIEGQQRLSRLEMLLKRKGVTIGDYITKPKAYIQ